MDPAVVRRPLAARVALIRLVFGLIWALDAWLKWQPDFISGFQDAVAEGAKHQAAFLKPWFDFWIHLTSIDPPILAVLTALLETLIAISLLFGLARRPMYIVGLSTAFSSGRQQKASAAHTPPEQQTWARRSPTPSSLHCCFWSMFSPDVPLLRSTAGSSSGRRGGAGSHACPAGPGSSADATGRNARSDGDGQKELPAGH